jgi:hypothetical protein
LRELKPAKQNARQPRDAGGCAGLEYADGGRSSCEQMVIAKGAADNLGSRIKQKTIAIASRYVRQHHTFARVGLPDV